jgi:hypothetical protein
MQALDAEEVDSRSWIPDGVMIDMNFLTDFFHDEAIMPIDHDLTSVLEEGGNGYSPSLMAAKLKMWSSLLLFEQLKRHSREKTISNKTSFHPARYLKVFHS